MSEELNESRIMDENELDENELEAKIKNAKGTKNEGIGILAFSAGLTIPIIVGGYLGYDLQNLSSLWGACFFVGVVGSIFGGVIGAIAYGHGRSALAYYQNVRDNSDIQLNLFK